MYGAHPVGAHEARSDSAYPGMLSPTAGNTLSQLSRLVDDDDDVAQRGNTSQVRLGLGSGFRWMGRVICFEIDRADVFFVQRDHRDESESSTESIVSLNDELEREIMLHQVRRGAARAHSSPTGRSRAEEKLARAGLELGVARMKAVNHRHRDGYGEKSKTTQAHESLTQRTEEYATGQREEHLASISTGNIKAMMDEMKKLFTQMAGAENLVHTWMESLKTTFTSRRDVKGSAKAEQWLHDMVLALRYEVLVVLQGDGGVQQRQQQRLALKGVPDELTVSIDAPHSEPTWLSDAFGLPVGKASHDRTVLRQQRASDSDENMGTGQCTSLLYHVLPSSVQVPVMVTPPAPLSPLVSVPCRSGYCFDSEEDEEFQQILAAVRMRRRAAACPN